MNNSSIGNYLCEAVSENGFVLMHFDRKDYITDQEGNKVVFKDAGKYSSLTSTFVAERAEGGFLIIDDNGIGMDFVFDEIGYENGNRKYYRPVRYTSMEGNNYWAYYTRSDEGTDMLRLNFYMSSDEEDIKLGEKLGDGRFFTIEHYPHQGTPYKTLGLIKNDIFDDPEIPLHKFSSLRCVYGEKEIIVGKEIHGNYLVMSIIKSDFRKYVFSDAPVHSPDGVWWAGRYHDDLNFVDLQTGSSLHQKRYKGGALKYREDLNVFLEYDIQQKDSVCNIWDMEWKTDIYSGHLWSEFQQIGPDMFRVINFQGVTHDLTLVELVKEQRDFNNFMHRKNLQIRHHNKNMLNVINEELKLMGFNALRKFCKTAVFADWTAYYFRTPRVRLADLEMKVILISVPVIKTEAPALILVESTTDNKLYVCNRLKTRLDESLFYLTVLFELTDFPREMFGNIPSGTKMKVADLVDKERGTLLDKLTGRKPAPTVKEPEPSPLHILMQQLSESDKEKTFPATKVEFDGTEYTLAPHQLWAIAEDPFYRNSFLPKDNGVYVLLNDNFVNDPMRAFVTTEGAFSTIPDYTIEGVGKDGQYIANGNANGHIILKRKDLYLFYRDMNGKLHFFDRATYWGHSEHGAPTRPILHIYLRSLLRKA